MRYNSIMERNKYSDMTDAQGLSLPFESLEFSAAWTDWVEKLLASDFSAINIEYSRRLNAARSKSGMTMAGEMARFIGR